MISKIKLKELIGSNKTKRVIDQLLKLSTDNDLRNEVVEQSRKLKEYKKAKRTGNISNEELSINLSHINGALLELIDQLPEELEIISNPVWWYVTNAAVIIGILAGFAEIFNFINIIPSPGPSMHNTESVTILVHSDKGISNKVLPNRGVVRLITGENLESKQINSEGEAIFQQIPEDFFEPGALVKVLFEDPEGEPYQAVNPDSIYVLKRGQYLGLEVTLLGMDKIHGIVKDFVSGDHISGATIRVKGEETVSNEFGEFELVIPEEKQEKFVTVRAYMDGYANWELSNIPTTTDQEISIMLKKK